MKPEISEFSYGYALTSNLVDRYDLKSAGAPIFPSLYEEGKTGGYDVELPKIAWFVQFKLSDCLKRGNARHAALIGVPHFRFEIRPARYSAQHQLLLDLEADGKDVFYCSPAFHTMSELNDAFRTGAVAARTVFVAPSFIGPLADPDDHDVAFVVGPGGVWFCSEPKEIRHETAEAIFIPSATRQRKFQPRPHRYDQFFTDLGEELMQVYEKSNARHRDIDTGSLRPVRPVIGPSRFAAYASQVLFGCQLFVTARQ
jgi:hypothetical protein